MGYELDRLMQQFGVGTPTLTYSGMQMPVKPTDLAAGASAMEKANYDALLAKYNADMPLYTSDQAKYKTYSTEYNNRMANTSLYDAPQFQRGAMSSPGTGAFTDQYSQMYQDVLGRLPDSAGLAYWKGKFGDMISPEEYAQFKSSAQTEIDGRPKLNPIFTPRTVLEQPTYNTPTAAPVLQTAATTTTNPYVLPGSDGSPAGGERSSNPNWDGMTAEQKAAFYDANPTFGAITRAGQKALDFIGIKSPLDSAIAKGMAGLNAFNASNNVLGIAPAANPMSQDPAQRGQAQRDQAAMAGSDAVADIPTVDATPAGSDAVADINVAHGGYIGSYAQGGAVRHYQAGGDVVDFEPSQDFKDAEKLTAILASRKLSPYEREDVESKLEEIYEKIKRRRVQDEPEALTEPVPIPESLMVRQVAPESLVTQQVAPRPSGGDLIQPMPESVPVTLRQISQAIAKATPLTALKEEVVVKSPPISEAAPLFRPLDPRLYGETDEVATGRGYSPFDPRLFGETNEVAKGKGYSPFDPRLFGETNEVATGPGYSMPVVARAAPPVVDRKLLDLAAKYARPGFTPTFASGSIDPGPDRMALISRNAIENKIANPVVNIQPEYADDSASRLSMDKPQDTTIPMSPNMAMLQKMLLANQSQTSPYADELRVARAASTAQTKAFNDMLEKAIKGQDDNKPSNAEMYFRLAAAFGAPTKTGNFFESLAEVNKSMAEQAKETRLAGKAGQALRLQLGLEGAKANMAAARDDVTALRALTSEEMKEKAAVQRELIKEYFKSGEAQSAAGKQAQDEGLIPGTPKYQARVTAISDEQFKRLTASVDASAAAAQASLASIAAGTETRLLQEKKFAASEARAKKAATQLSGPELKMKEETSQALVTMRDAYADLVKALKLSANAYDGSLADQALYKPLALAGNKDPKVVNTGVLDNILKLGALSTAATTLKTQISDSDMKMLNQVQGAGAKSREERDAILKAAMVRMENMYQEKKSKLADIVSGKYRVATPAIAEEAE